MGRRALVLGSEGNIGKPLVRYLRTMGYEVLESDIKAAWRPGYIMGDIRNPSDLIPAFDWQPDVVFMMAAMVSRVTCEQASSLAIETNVAGLQHILDLTKRSNAHIVHFSTSEVYGPELGVMDERLVPRPNNRYGLSKLLGDLLVQYEVEQHGLSAVILRPFMMYDEDEDLGDHRSAMIRFATNLAQRKPIELHHNSARGWLHVSDAVRAIEAAAHIKDFSVINVGHPDVRPMREVAELICREVGAPTSLIVEIDLPPRMTAVKRPTLDRQSDLLGIVPQVSLEDGVKRVCTKLSERLARIEALV